MPLGHGAVLCSRPFPRSPSESRPGIGSELWMAKTGAPWKITMAHYNLTMGNHSCFMVNHHLCVGNNMFFLFTKS